MYYTVRSKCACVVCGSPVRLFVSHGGAFPPILLAGGPRHRKNWPCRVGQVTNPREPMLSPRLSHSSPCKNRRKFVRDHTAETATRLFSDTLFNGRVHASYRPSAAITDVPELPLTTGLLPFQSWYIVFLPPTRLAMRVLRYSTLSSRPSLSSLSKSIV